MITFLEITDPKLDSWCFWSMQSSESHSLCGKARYFVWCLCSSRVSIARRFSRDVELGLLDILDDTRDALGGSVSRSANQTQQQHLENGTRELTRQSHACIVESGETKQIYFVSVSRQMLPVDDACPEVQRSYHTVERIPERREQVICALHACANFVWTIGTHSARTMTNTI